MKKVVAFGAVLFLLAGCSAPNVSDEAAGDCEIDNTSELCVDNAANAAPEEPTAEPLPVFELSSLREDPEVCKIQEDSRMRSPGDVIPNYGDKRQIRGGYSGNATAFPFNPTTLPITGDLNVSFIFVDWEDSQGTQEDYEYYQGHAQLFEDFYWMASEHKLKMNITFSESWFRIPGSYRDFVIDQAGEAQRGEAPLKQVFYDAAVEASDEATDYSDADIVFYAVPTDKTVFEMGGPHEFNFDWNGYLDTDEGKIYNITAAGDWWLDHTEYGGPWLLYVHEVGHMLGIPHQANEDQEFRDESIDWRTVHWLQNPINGYEIMGNQDGPTKTLSSWLRWLPGWLEDDQVICITEDSVVDEVFELHPINDANGKVESLVIRLNETMVVVVESRRFDPKFDSKIPHSRDGIIAYTVDATKATAQGNMALLSPRDITKWLEVDHWRGSQTLDANFCQGDSVNVGWLKIEAVSVQDRVDYVRVTKTDEWVDPAAPRDVIGKPSFLSNECVKPPGQW